MKEIKMAGNLECNFNTQLQKHMDNVGSKLNALVDAIKLARNDGDNLTVDIRKLEKEEEKKMKAIKTPLQRHMDNAGNQLKEESQGNINSRKEYTVKVKVDTYELDCAIKKLKRINKLVKKIKAHQIV